MIPCDRTLNYRLECLHLLGKMSDTNDKETCINWKNMKDTIEHYTSHYLFTETDKQLYFDSILQVYDHVSKNINLKEQQLKILFSPISPFEYSPALLIEIINFFYNSTGKSKEEILEAHIIFLYHYLFDSCLSQQENPHTIQELMKFMNEFDDKLNDTSRFRILELLLCYDDYELEINKILDQAIPLFQEKESLFKPMIDQQCEELDRLLGLYHDSSGLLKLSGLNLDLLEVPIHISVMSFSAINVYSAPLSESDVINESNISIYYGILVHYISNLIDIQNLSTETLIKHLKVLSDKTRFEILCQLKDGDKYGQELAQLLNLTPATISHHMYELASSSFINIKTSGNRMIYETNREKLKEFINSLHKKIID